MSEGMALEKLAEEHARLQGYLTLVRVPFKPPKRRGTKHRGNTDFDVLGYSPKSHKVLLVEVKGYGSPHQYPDWSYFRDRRDPLTSTSVNGFVTGAVKKWQAFTRDRAANSWGFRRGDLGEVRVIIPGYWKQDRQRFEDYLDSLVLKKCHQRGIRVSVWPVHELILDILRMVKDDKLVRRVRYADTALEAFRWITRRPDLLRAPLEEILHSKRLYPDIRKVPGFPQG